MAHKLPISGGEHDKGMPAGKVFLLNFRATLRLLHLFFITFAPLFIFIRMFMHCINSKRIYYLDYLKAFAIFTVILGHSIQSFKGSAFMGSLYNFIYSFHIDRKSVV